uniref:Uncharacterized protein n=1 Tax=Coccidioides posadasii RMSCC 3488 TaxID=454284 RepID=A0A0J6FHU7_COCPO|nr:hypothetical protein CPAG_05273 [Coccidioides posadasii RMSCC 3488]
MPQNALSVEHAVDKLVNASKLVEQRPGLKPAEEARVIDAFNLMATGTGIGTGAKRRTVYLEFLQRVNSVLGRDKVVLCAAILGPSAVGRMKDRTRVELLHRMKE